MTTTRNLVMAALALGLAAAPAGADESRLRLAQQAQPTAPLPTPVPSPAPPAPAGSPGSASEPAAIVAKFTPQVALQMAQEAGLEKPEITVNDDKSTSVYGEASGAWIELSLGDCAAACDDELTLYAIIAQPAGTDLASVNAYNAQASSVLYIDGDGDLILSRTVVAEGGITPQNGAALLRRFVREVTSLSQSKPK